MTTNIEASKRALAALGFTEIEAAILCELLRGPPATGYRLAKAIGKAVANTYQALADLTAKGAVMIDNGETKTYRAIPPSELLSGLQHAFDASRREAEAALEALHAPVEDDCIYQLKTTSQIYERADGMIAGAGEILLFDLFPEPLARLEPALRQAHARGVVVAGLVYDSPPSLPFPVVVANSSTIVAERWPGLQLSLVADAREHLLALLSPDGATVRHGVWSDSAYLACLAHSGLAAEIQMSSVNPSEEVPFRHLSLLRSYPSGLARLIGPRVENQHQEKPPCSEPSFSPSC
jgi:HTH-type transcriptional regulator, sugar sensing transcriptional regulator